jgi:hypothetical protein
MEVSVDAELQKRLAEAQARLELAKSELAAAEEGLQAILRQVAEAAPAGWAAIRDDVYEETPFVLAVGGGWLERPFGLKVRFFRQGEDVTARERSLLRVVWPTFPGEVESVNISMGEIKFIRDGDGQVGFFATREEAECQVATWRKK